MFYLSMVTFSRMCKETIYAKSRSSIHYSHAFLFCKAQNNCPQVWSKPIAFDVLKANNLFYQVCPWVATSSKSTDHYFVTWNVSNKTWYLRNMHEILKNGFAIIIYFSTIVR